MMDEKLGGSLLIMKVFMWNTINFIAKKSDTKNKTQQNKMFTFMEFKIMNTPRFLSIIKQKIAIMKINQNH